MQQKKFCSAHWFDPFGSVQFSDLICAPAVSAADPLDSNKPNHAVTRYLFWDQEPLHQTTVDQTLSSYRDLYNYYGQHYLVTSEHNSDFVNYACDTYGFQPCYYFFHGWAALDWYRGYNKTFLIPDPRHRRITKSFINPNRIIGGQRDHRSLLLYHLFRTGVNRAWISAPQICVSENTNITDIVAKYQYRYPDILDVLSHAPLPMHLPNETDHPMHSCWLSLWDQIRETCAYVVTETVFFGRRHFLTEKIFKPICQQIPFVLVSAAGSLEYLRRYGFRTFGDVWDESYDEESDDLRRLEKIADLLHDLDGLSARELDRLYQATYSAVKHNYEHFYGGGFERILWCEMTTFLDSIEQDRRDQFLL